MKNEGTVFVGGTVLAGPDQTPQKNHALYVENGTIREIGPAAEIRGRYPNAKVVDASSATIVPGLIDAHAHLYGLGLALDTVNLVDTKSVAEIASRVAERAGSTPPGDWVLGRGWDQNDWDVKQFPAAASLDGAIAGHPVWLKRIDGHAGWANTAALRAAGVTRD
ncbi:MAG: amidohydrolase family protein, partial [Thermoanaerobaculia bacterium]